MSQNLFEEIPSVDLADFLSGDANRKANFVQQLGKAYEEVGFVAVKNHGYADKDREELYEIVKKLFQLPDEQKQKYELPQIQYQRAYTGKNKETAKGFKTPDMKEFWHVGQEFSDEDAQNDAQLREYPKNVWIEELPEMKAVCVKAYKTLEEAGKNLLRAIALYLNLDEYYFDDKIKNGNSIIRALHYFPILNPDAVPADAVRAAAHGDINLITLLMGASADGLQVLRHDGKWIPVTALPEQVVVNVGDMLSRLTNNRLKSTIHRVVNPPRQLMHTSRYSIPFFMHPRSEMDLTCLESCIDEKNPKLYEDITAGDFLQERLRELGFGK